MEFLNLVFGHSEESETYWDVLLATLALRFPQSTETLPPDFNLKTYIAKSCIEWEKGKVDGKESSNDTMSGLCVLFVKFVRLTSIQFTGTVLSHKLDF